MSERSQTFWIGFGASMLSAVLLGAGAFIGARMPMVLDTFGLLTKENLKIELDHRDEEIISSMQNLQEEKFLELESVCDFNLKEEMNEIRKEFQDGDRSLLGSLGSKKLAQHKHHSSLNRVSTNLPVDEEVVVIATAYSFAEGTGEQKNTELGLTFRIGGQLCAQSFDRHRKKGSYAHVVSTTCVRRLEPQENSYPILVERHTEGVGQGNVFLDYVLLPARLEERKLGG